MGKILQSRSVAAWLGIVLYLGVTAWFWKPLPQRAAPEVSQVSGPRRPSWEFSNPEVDQLVAELKQQKSALAEREKQLNELALRLKTEQAELNATTQQVYQLQVNLDKTIVRVQEEETGNLKKLARVYAAMSPDGAAGILKQLDEASVVKIMLYMKEDESAPVLETLSKLGDIESRLAASISEHLRLAVFRKPAGKPKS
jgi:flagellar motility protein MotE (MotC chaperone)